MVLKLCVETFCFFCFVDGPKQKTIIEKLRLVKHHFPNIKGVLVPKFNVSSFFCNHPFIQKEKREIEETLSRTTL